MGVAEDHGGDVCGLWVQVEVLPAMHQIEQLASKFDRLGRWQRSAGAGAIDIATNRRDRRNFSQSFQNFIVADIAGVENMRAPCERMDSFWTQQPVRVGNYANPHVNSLHRRRRQSECVGRAGRAGCRR